MSLNRFRWVVCQFDRLRRNFPSSIRRVLADLPESLDKTYEQALLGIDKEKRIYAQCLFQCLSVSIRPLRVEELAEILAVELDSTAVPSFNEDLRPPDAEEAVLSACSSLIAIVDREGGQIVQFSHFSVKEYLTSDRPENTFHFYHILPEPAHVLLAHVGLSVLLRLDDKIDKNAIDHFPSRHMPLDIGTMLSLGTCRPTLRMSWNVCLIRRSHILRRGSGFMTLTAVIGWIRCRRYV